ncbi:hypothetical protein Tco_1167455 [Tanacetum coccineum]
MSIIPSLPLIIITSLFISSITCNSNSDGDHFKGAVFNVNYKFYGRKKVLLDDFKAFDSIRHLHLLAGGAVDLKIGVRMGGDRERVGASAPASLVICLLRTNLQRSF